MKRRIWLISLPIIGLAIGATLYLASRHVERQRIAANARHDAEWFFLSLASGNENAAAAAVRGTESEADRLGMLLAKHAATIRRADFASLEPSLTESDGLSLATFECGGGVLVVFSSTNGGELWFLADIVGP